MSRSAAGLLAGLALVLAATVRLAAAQAFGSLFVSSLPVGADVWIDGSYIGRTPALVAGLSPGKHSLTVTLAGWKAQEADQQVTTDTTTLVSVQLEPQTTLRATGKIVLNGADPRAKVRIDGGSWQAQQPAYTVAVGMHTVALRIGSDAVERSVTVYPDQSTHLLLRSGGSDAHAAVVAPLADYLPVSSARVGEDGRLVIRWNNHVVTGRIGDARFSVDDRDVTYDAPAGMVRGKLYLPLDLILAITGRKPY